MVETTESTLSPMPVKSYIPFDTVYLVGGTHGNERTGVSLVQHWAQSPSEIQRETFATRLLLANPQAIEKNIRFIDCDLNRSFLPRLLEDHSNTAYEVGRAREIVKTFSAERPGKRTFAIDLHTTTARMGITLITNTVPVNLAIAARVRQKMAGVRIYSFDASDRINSCLRAAADGGIGVEIGPIPQGVIRHDTLAITRQVVRQILDAIEAHNRETLTRPDEEVTIYLHDRHVFYPEQPSGATPVFVHQALQGQDYHPLAAGHPIFQNLEGRIWPYEGPSPRYPVFINEAAYYHENIAFSLTRRIALASLLSI